MFVGDAMWSSRVRGSDHCRTDRSEVATEGGAGSASGSPRRFRLGTRRGEEAATLGRGGEIDTDAEWITVGLQDVLGGEIPGEGRLALAQVREHLEDEI